MVKKFVEFKQGTLAKSPYPELPLEKWDPETDAIPKDYVAYRIKKKAVVDVKGEEIIGETLDVSGWNYNGKKVNLEQLKDAIPAEKYQELRLTGCRKVVVTSEGLFPFWAVDKIIGEE